MKVPAIVIATYNRAKSLQRLLNSVSCADYSNYNDIPLIISIDGGGGTDVLRVAYDFLWNYGEKIIIEHNSNIGLRNHIISCGDLTEKYDRIIMLEDDLMVSPYFYDYAVKASDYYRDDDRIAGISLYLYRFHEYSNNAFFIPLYSGMDVFFMQVPSSLGQLWTKKQWQSFKKFYNEGHELNDTDKLPDSVKKWPASSWKKYFYKYMVQKDLYFVYPYVSYTTNMAEAGTHLKTAMSVCQTPLMYQAKNMFLFPEFSFKGVVYDAYMEILPEYFRMQGLFVDKEFIVDLYGNKPLELYNEPYCISSKQCNSPIYSFAMQLIPLESNILQKLDGDDIVFAATNDFIDNDKLRFRKLCALLYDMWNAEFFYNIGYIDGVNHVYRTRTYKLGKKITTLVSCIWGNKKKK